MCGILGIFNYFSNTQITHEIQEKLLKIQHRGQDSFGYYLNYKNFTQEIRELGLIKTRKILNSYKVALGHNRYATSYINTKNKVDLIQPFKVTNIKLGTFIIVHNGNINNLANVRNYFDLESDSDIQLNDSQLLARILETSTESHIEKTLPLIMQNIRGIFNLLIYHENTDTLYAMKDKFGNRPLCLGMNRRGICVASESVALGNYDYIREVEAGELIKINNSSYQTIHRENPVRQTCLFEYIYLQNKNSIAREIKYDLEDNKKTITIENIREDFGVELARKEKTHINKNKENMLVIGAPNTGIPIGKKFAECLELPYGQFIMKRKGTHRSFIQPNNESRLAECYRKFIIDENLSIEDKIVFFVDDSLVRGNTINTLINLLQSFKPREIHFRIASPEVKFPCFYGIDIPTSEELIMNHYKSGELAQKLGIQSLVFLSTGEMETVLKKNMKLDKKKICMACFDGEYNPLLEF